MTPLASGIEASAIPLTHTTPPPTAIGPTLANVSFMMFPFLGFGRILSGSPARLRQGGWRRTRTGLPVMLPGSGGPGVVPGDHRVVIDHLQPPDVAVSEFERLRPGQRVDVGDLDLAGPRARAAPGLLTGCAGVNPEAAVCGLSWLNEVRLKGHEDLLLFPGSRTLRCWARARRRNRRLTTTTVPAIMAAARLPRARPLPRPATPDDEPAG